MLEMKVEEVEAMLDKLRRIEEKYMEIERKMAQPDYYADPPLTRSSDASRRNCRPSSRHSGNTRSAGAIWTGPGSSCPTGFKRTGAGGV
jgi:hypothetical protein